MKTFIAYRFTGEDPARLEPLLKGVQDTFAQRGVEAYCTFFDEDEFKNKSFNARQIMDHAFGIIDNSDFLFVLMTSENKSEGMIMEVGYCIAKDLPVIVAIKSGVSNTYIPDMGTQKIVWTDQNDLFEKIKQINLVKDQ